MTFLEQLTAIELNILNWIQDVFSCAFLDWFFPLITKLGDHGIFWIAVAVILLFFKKTRATGIMMGVALLTGLLVGNVTLKPLIGRIRPYDTVGARDITLLVERLTDGSFPSGHTLASLEAATVLVIRDKRLGIPAMIAAILVALSRLYLYVHFPTDVLAGALLGVLFAFFAVWIVKFVWKKTTGKELQ